ncbi:MAG TPA: alpha-amylase family glycosyl hydrolase, partial [Vicinamibacteria bacterium]
VYNHTAEGNHLGPTLSMRGIDNAAYYKLDDDKRYYTDYTGTGNSLNVRHPQTLRLIMDSLRYWITEMHVDGFRFDLASTLARSLHEVDMLSGFFTIINQDPIIRKAKLIAEPWDVGEGGYQVGQFPVNWAEWNGKFRDGVRRFWRDGCCRNEIALRLTGSPDLYQQGGRTPAESINLVTTHDGFTLRDLVSYDRKHNEANQEGNCDGAEDNLSWNCGVEGETEDPEIRRLRARQVRNFLATLLLSHGTPMLCGGDEIGRTQRGNNNAYCQDNEIGWYDWTLDEPARALLAFTRRAIGLRKRHPLLRRGRFTNNREDSGAASSREIAWFRSDGQLMTEDDWRSPGSPCLGVFFSASGLDDTDEQGRPLRDDDLALLLNPTDEDRSFVIPMLDEKSEGHPWKLLLDTDDDEAAESIESETATLLRRRSLKVFARRARSSGGLSAVYGAAASTYRIQLSGEFGFRQASGILGYLAALGAGAVYSSPFLRAESGSTHGYNVADHGALNPELGGEDAYRAWTEAMKAAGLRHLADFVPNHVGIGSGENRWWLDVLENGPSSQYGDFFDIDWEPPTGGLRNKVLLPVLGGQFGEELEAGRFQLVRDGGRFWLTYFERR